MTKNAIELEIAKLEALKKKQEYDAVFLENAKKLLNGKFFLDLTDDKHFGSIVRHVKLYFIKEVIEIREHSQLLFDGFSTDIRVLPPRVIRDWKKLKPVFGNIAFDSRYNLYTFDGIYRDLNNNASLKQTCVEKTEEEAMFILRGIIDIQNNIYNQVNELIESGKTATEDCLRYSLQDLFNLRELEEYLLKNPILSLQAAVSKLNTLVHNRFNYNAELESLVQYDKNGSAGLYLDIAGGDGGTDYEPYVTHYYINHVHIKWEEILYPIRLKLNCKVFDLVEKLNKIKEVYNTSNWEVVYFGEYDVTFQHAKLNKSTLDKINSIIKQHLKQ